MIKIIFSLWLFILSFSTLAATPALNSLSLPVRENIEKNLQIFLGNENENLSRLNLSRLEGGVSEAVNLYFSHQGTPMVLRYLDRTRGPRALVMEARAYQEAAELGISPRVHYVSEDSGVIISDFIPVPTLKNSEMRDPKVLDHVIATMKQIHGLTTEFNPKRSFANYWLTHFYGKIVDKIEEAGKPIPPIVEKVGAEIPRLEREFHQMEVAPVPSHWDLQPRNMFSYNNRILLVDWESAMMDDPYGDLGYFSVSQCFNESQDRSMLEKYLERQPTEAESLHLRSAKHLALGRFGLGMLAHVNRQGFDIFSPAELSRPLKPVCQYYEEFSERKQPDTLEFFFEMGLATLNLFLELRK